MAYVSGAQTADIQRANTISTALEDFEPVLQRAAQYADRLQKLSDRIHGPSPAEVRKNDVSDASIPHSVISSIHQRRSQLIGILDAMEQSIGGLEGGI